MLKSRIARCGFAELKLNCIVLKKICVLNFQILCGNYIGGSVEMRSKCYRAAVFFDPSLFLLN
jgi:hypothetical protein